MPERASVTRPQSAALRALCVLALLAATCVPAVLHAGKEHVRTVTHFSETLGREKTYSIYIPPARAENERFPVVFLLHGAWGNHRDWVERTQVAELAESYRMMLVFPDGDPFGWYVDSTQDEDSNYETYITQELVAEIDTLFPTVATREGRAIMGLSMGGHGALLLAAKHPDVFSSASSLSGVLDITAHAHKWNIAARLGPLDENREDWQANSVVHQAERFADGRVRILFDCGSGDVPTGILQDNHLFRDRLLELGIPHVWRELPGGHEWTYWDAYVHAHLNFHQANLLEATEGITGFWRHYFVRIGRFLGEAAEWSLDPPEGPILLTIGSSSVEGFPAELLPDYRIVNRSISADNVGIGRRGVANRYLSSVVDVPADFVMIKIGRNDLGNRHNNGTPSIAAIVEQYERILDVVEGVHPQAPVFVVSSFPTGGRYGHLVPAIIDYNERLRMITRDRANVRFLDVHALLRDESGFIQERYSRDGLHLTRAGNAVWARVLDEAIQQRIAELEAPADPVNLPADRIEDESDDQLETKDE